MVDYHLHTSFCDHAGGTMDEYADAAMRAGLAEIGFADHAPVVFQRNTTYAMEVASLPFYQAGAEQVRARYGKLAVRIGLEADFFPGHEEKTRAMLAAYPYDFVIGSVHFIDDWGFDDPDECSRWNDKNVDRVYADYYGLLRRSAESGLFDIMGHVDLVKKFGHRPLADFTHELEKTAAVFKRTGVTIEINTSGLRKTVGEIYPSLEALTVYRKAGVPITFGSDAHVPSDVGRDFDKAVRLARDAGYGEYLTFKQRKVERAIPL